MNGYQVTGFILAIASLLVALCSPIGWAIADYAIAGGALLAGAFLLWVGVPDEEEDKAPWQK